MAGITRKGFVPKTLREIRADIIAQCQLIQDPNTGEYPLFNIGDDTVLSQVIGVFSAELEVAWGALADAYAQFDPQLNTGAGQSGTVQLNAITRKPGKGTQIAIEVTAKANTLIPRESLISDVNGTVSYSIDQDIAVEGVAGETVTAAGTATALEFGPYNPVVNTVNTIQTPINGWMGVTNTRTIVVGLEEETDPTLRKRQQRSTALTSYRQIEAIWAAIMNIDDVTYCRVYQNDKENPVDSRGIPFKEVAAIVEGGKDEEIAEALFYRLPTGQIGYGTTSVTFNDLQGIPYQISFSRPEPISIYIAVKLEIYDSADWPSNGIDLIKTAIIDYAEYNMGDDEVGFPPGTDVIRTRLYTPINSVPGHSVLSLKLSTNGTTWIEDDIPVAWNQLAVFDASRINITLS